MRLRADASQQTATPPDTEERSRSAAASSARHERTHSGSLAPLQLSIPDKGTTSGGPSTVRDEIERHVSRLRALRLLNLESPAITPHLELLVNSERQRRPGVPLRLLSGASTLEAVAADLLRQPLRPPGLQWEAVIDAGCHRVAASIRHAGDDARRVSVILLDSLLSNVPMPYRFAQLQQALASGGWDLRVSVIGTHTQKGGGCSFFALSATKYMGRSAAIESLHDTQLAPRPQGDAGPPVLMFRVHPHCLEPGFFKHATSPKVVEAYLADQADSVADAPVNKRGETLRDRVGRHLVTRSSGTLSHTYSMSIEHKKIVLYERALATMGDALDRPAAADSQGDCDIEGKDTHTVAQPGIEHLLQSLCTYGSVDEVLPKLTLAGMKGLDLSTWRDERGATALHLAARFMPSPGSALGCSRSGDFERLARQLVGQGVAVDARDDYGRTALHEATSDVEHCRALLDLGANPHATSIWGNSALFAAPSGAVIQLLVSRGVDPNARACDGVTPLRSNAELFGLSCDGLEALMAAGASMDADTRALICGCLPAERRPSVPDVDAPVQTWVQFLRQERAHHAGRLHGAA